MKRLLLVCLVVVNYLSCLDRPLKVLHITFHNGCKQDFKEVAQELGLDLTTWYVQDLPRGAWEGSHSANEIYNVGPQRAARVWNLHKVFFNTFDCIITSDTAPLSRIFLQHCWEKPLIIWVCNRFDYAHGNGGEDRFPDKGYYDLIRKATTMPNVKIISYTPYEYEYARRKGIDFGTMTIKPLGRKDQDVIEASSVLPNNLLKSETLLLFPRLEANRVELAMQECSKRGLKVWTGVYNGPDDLKQFKGVLFFPYAFSNLALFENLQRGIVHFVPTKRFLTQLGFIRGGMQGNLDWCEWYLPEYKEALVFFDSWDDLKYKIQNIDYEAMKVMIKVFGRAHRVKMLNEWRRVFDECVTFIK